MSKLDEDIRAANALGISYGYYKARTYDQSMPMASPQKKTRNRPTRRFTDEMAFALWQKGYTDEQIGQSVGISRQFIQRWRDQFELPSTSKFHINTKKYRLTTLRDGTYVVITTD